MKHMRSPMFLPSLLSALLGVMTMAATCGSDASSCVFDSDCRATALCVQELCMETCTSDEDCAQDDPDPDDELFSCQTYSGGDRPEPVSVCAAPDFFSEKVDPTDCRSNLECRERLQDDSARCSLAKTCFIPSQEHALLITDVSPPETQGVELLAAFIQDSNDQIIGYGATESFNPKIPVEKPALLNGEPPTLDNTAQCTTPANQTRVALKGAGGQTRIIFVDAKGRRLQWQQGWKVVVIESGANCAQPDPQDEYDAAFCVSPSGQPVDPLKDCTRILGQRLSGFSSLEVPLIP